MATRFASDGFVSGVPVVSVDDATGHRRRLEAAEAVLGDVHYVDKVHTVLTSPWELATHPAALEVVEACIGPDICVYNVTYIIKEPGTAAHVAWHQDLTYWGLIDHDAQVSMWLALSPATEASGCMKMIPGSHRRGRVEHTTRRRDDNVLNLGQQIEGVDASDAILCSLEPGEASFHHGWTVHASAPNRSHDRRIGVNVQYVAPHNRHLGSGDTTAALVRGEDHHGFFGVDTPAAVDAAPEAVARWRELDAAMKAGFAVR